MRAGRLFAGVIAVTSCLMPLAGRPPSASALARKSPGIEDPYQGSADATAAGARIFRRECSHCHGNEGKGIGKAPDLSAVVRQPPGELFRLITDGSLRKGMPSFAHLPEQRRWQLVTFLLRNRFPD